MIIGEKRNYEVSLWTLQDEFITVLKWSDVEQVGRVQDPKFELNVDGTQKFTFSIPMYLNKWIEGVDGHMTCIENPIWYRENFLSRDLSENMNSVSFNEMNWREIEQGNLITSMRKIKLIFNKFDPIDKNVFEFLITKVTEEHKDGQLMCQVECEGLAFHELGKIGYKINLSQDNFELTYKEYKETGHWKMKDGTVVYEEPIQSVQYWCDQCEIFPQPSNPNPNQWYYTIQMNWDTSASGYEKRIKTKVYENQYTSSWSTSGSRLIPATIEQYREKARPVSAENSNLYNITQTIAETFGIYCKYEYDYDENYHIISRTIVFYNNYINENAISFTYPYSSKSISREMDGTELTTKMYVVPQEDSTILGGMLTIADSPANPTGEDYLLNFDYMYIIGAITKEQYDAIAPYKAEMHTFNQELEDYSLHLNAENNQKIDLEAKIQVLENSIAPVQEQIDNASALYNTIDESDGDADGYFEKAGANHYTTMTKKDKYAVDKFYITFADKGIKSDTLKVYAKYKSADASFDETYRLSLGDYIKDEYNNITGVYISKPSGNTTEDFVVAEAKTMHAVYKYKPQLYYQEIIDTFTEKKKNIDTELETLNSDLTTCKNNITTYTDAYNEKLDKKEKAVAAFETLMGPALREGYWQPDEYMDYGEQKEAELTLPMAYSNIINNDAQEGAIVAWDTEPFDNEDKVYYEEKVSLEKQYYPCIDLSSENQQILAFIQAQIANNKKISFIFNNNYNKDLTNDEKNDIQNISNFTVGGKSQFGFLKIADGTIKPVLVITGAKTMTDDQIKFMLTADKGHPRICVFDTKIENKTTKVVLNPTAGYSVDYNHIYWEQKKMGNTSIHEITTSGVEMVYPRIKFSDLRLKPYDTTLIVTYKNNQLEKYYDYSLFTRNTLREDQPNTGYKAYLEYFITLKPDTIFKYNLPTEKCIVVDYILSNAATSVYLDGEEVLHDSAFPRVSYNIEVNVLDDTFSRDLYKKLTQLVMINDTDLKFSNVFGYISSVNLDLDQPQNDTIEVKNYTTKFEDLFSTIVASSEAMKRNGNAIASATMGNVSLTGEALTGTFETNSSILQAYLDSHFDSSAVVKARLAEIFEEAGKILSDANKSLNNVANLNAKNASILSGFVSAIQKELTPKVYTSRNQPLSFKVGDIWNQTDETGGRIIGSYVSTTGSEDGGGFTRTYDGTLAAITGASMNIDAVAGTMEFLAQSKIDIKSGGNIYIAANDTVDIVGNRAVNIGGTTVNLGAAPPPAGSSVDLDTCSGINLVTASIDSADWPNVSGPSISKVLIHPKQIEMASSNIIMKGASRIVQYVSDETLGGTSAVQIDTTDGVWIGSGKGIQFYMGANDLVYNDSTQKLNTGDNVSASVEINSSHLLFGVSSSNNNAAAIEMTDDYFILAKGRDIAANSVNPVVVTGADGGLIGMKLTNDSFGLAVTSTDASNNTITTAMLLDKNGFTIGSAGVNVATDNLRDMQNGSYTRINKEGIELGSLADLYINTNNIKLQTHSRDKNNQAFIDGYTILALGNGMQEIGYDTSMDTVRQLATRKNNPLDIRLVVNHAGAYINGDIYADNGIFNGEVYAKRFIAQGTYTDMKVDGTTFGFYNKSGVGLLTVDAYGSITAANNLTISAGTFSVLSSAAVSIQAGGTIYLGSKNPTDNTWVSALELSSSGTINIAAAGSLTMKADSGNSVIINKNGIEIISGKKLIVDTSTFKIDSSGNVEMTGKITSTKGSIAGWNITDDSLYKGDRYTGTYVALGYADYGDNGNRNYVFWAGAPYPEDNPDNGGDTNSFAPVRIRAYGRGDSAIFTNNLWLGRAPSHATDWFSSNEWGGWAATIYVWAEWKDGDTTKSGYQPITGQELWNAIKNGGGGGGAAPSGGGGGGTSSGGGGSADTGTTVTYDTTYGGGDNVYVASGTINKDNLPEGYDWQQVSDGRYWFGKSENDYAVSKWIHTDDNWYYVDGSGYMLFNCTATISDGGVSAVYTFDGSGKATTASNGSGGGSDSGETSTGGDSGGGAAGGSGGTSIGSGDAGTETDPYLPVQTVRDTDDNFQTSWRWFSGTYGWEYSDGNGDADNRYHSTWLGFLADADNNIYTWYYIDSHGHMVENSAYIKAGNRVVLYYFNEQGQCTNPNA